MAPTRTRIRIERVVLPMEAEETDHDLMELAGTLAAALEAELAGLFIKAEDLMNLAALPGLQTVISRTGAKREFQPGEMDVSLERLAARARRRLQEQASRRKLAFSFETLTGRKEDVISSRARQSELIALSRLPGAAPPPAGMGDNAPLFIMPRRLLARGPVALVYTGSTATLRTAARLSRSLGRDLLVLIPPGEDAATRQRTARAWLTRQKISAPVVTPDHDDADFLAAVRATHPALVIAECGSEYETALLGPAAAPGAALLLLPR